MSSDALSFLASAFDASSSYFASAVSSLDLNKIQISPASSAQSSNALHVDFTLPKGVTVQTLIWIYAGLGSKGGLKKAQKKKRKRSLTTTGGSLDLSHAADLENALVAIGTNKGDILLFSPVQGSIIFTLSGVHAVPVTSLAADSISSSKLWSCDNSGRVSEWDLTLQKSIRSFAFSEPDVSFLQSVSSPSNGLLIASNAVYLVDSNNPTAILKTFPSFIHQTSSIISSSDPDIFFAASYSERNVGLISFSKEKTVGLLVAQSDVKQLVVNADSSAVCIVTEDGFVEIFADPLSSITDKISTTSSKSKSRKAKAVSSIPSTTTIKLFRPGASTKKPFVKIQNAWFQEDHVIITWAEHGSVPVFEQIKWRSSTGEAITKPIEITKAVRVVSGHQTALTDSAAAARYQESHTLVKSGSDFSKLEENLVQANSDDEDEEGGTLADRLDALEVSDAKSKEEPENTTSLSTLKPLKTPDSFALILAQALKTNDHVLLESCLYNNNEMFIQTSIKRLDSSLAVALLERLAEKIARAPNRTTALTVWIKWVITIHGGYLVSLPNLTKSLSSLHSTLANKISMLPRLLELYGRVEMLRTQMELRREILAPLVKEGGPKNGAEEGDSEIDSEVEYVEDAHLIVNGEEDFSDDDEDDAAEGQDVSMNGANSGFIELEAGESSDNESEVEEEDAGMSDVDAEGVAPQILEYDSDELSEEEPTKKSKSKMKRAYGAAAAHGRK